jgi:hypothetical protein
MKRGIKPGRLVCMQERAAAACRTSGIDVTHILLKRVELASMTVGACCSICFHKHDDTSRSACSSSTSSSSSSGVIHLVLASRSLGIMQCDEPGVTMLACILAKLCTPTHMMGLLLPCWLILACSSALLCSALLVLCHAAAAAVQGWGENDRGVSYTFGPDCVTDFLQRHDLDLVCRAHQVRLHTIRFYTRVDDVCMSSVHSSFVQPAEVQHSSCLCWNPCMWLWVVAEHSVGAAATMHGKCLEQCSRPVRCC